MIFFFQFFRSVWKIASYSTVMICYYTPNNCSALDCRHRWGYRCLKRYEKTVKESELPPLSVSTAQCCCFSTMFKLRFTSIVGPKEEVFFVERSLSLTNHFRGTDQKLRADKKAFKKQFKKQIKSTLKSTNFNKKRWAALLRNLVVINIVSHQTELRQKRLTLVWYS